MARKDKANDVVYNRQRRADRQASPYRETGVCNTCGVILSELNWRLYDYKMTNMICEFCRGKKASKQWTKQKSRINDYNRMRLYGVTPDAFKGLEEQAQGKCNVCGQEAPLCVDHDHSTGVVRGLLCHSCNRGLGLLGDSLESLEMVVTYLKGGGLSHTSA